MSRCLQRTRNHSSDVPTSCGSLRTKLWIQCPSCSARRQTRTACLCPAESRSAVCSARPYTGFVMPSLRYEASELTIEGDDVQLKPERTLIKHQSSKVWFKFQDMCQPFDAPASWSSPYWLASLQNCRKPVMSSERGAGRRRVPGSDDLHKGTHLSASACAQLLMKTVRP